MPAATSLGRLSEVQVPVLLLAGGLYFPGIETGMREMARQLPNAEMHRLDGCVQLPSIESPELVNQHLESFLARLPGSTR